MVQRWWPDTCSCKLLRDYDPNTDTFTILSYENVCNIHSSISNASQRHDAIVNQNQRRSIFYNKILEQFPALFAETNSEGTITLKKGITFNFSWSGTGTEAVLIISFTGINLNNQQKTNLQNLANSQFGSGKVIVQ